LCHTYTFESHVDVEIEVIVGFLMEEEEEETQQWQGISNNIVCRGWKDVVGNQKLRGHDVSPSQ